MKELNLLPLPPFQGRFSEFWSELRRIAGDAGSIGPLRKAAIHALGQLGEAEDLELLGSLPQNDRYLAQAIGPAKKKLLARLGR